jgi:hypothetical protein
MQLASTAGITADKPGCCTTACLHCVHRMQQYLWVLQCCTGALLLLLHGAASCLG